MFGLLKKRGLEQSESFPGLAAYDRVGIIQEGSRSILYKVISPDGEFCLKIFKENAAITIDKILRIGMKWEGDWNLNLEHENMVETYYAGKENEIYYLLLEYLGGSTLLHCIYFEPKHIAHRKLEIAVTITECVAYIHSQGIIHRDLCPKNFMFDDSYEQLKIIDFGIALSTIDRVLKRAGVTGTPSYMAPEIFANRFYSMQTDVFALGVTLYEFYTGVKPYKVNIADAEARLMRHFQADPPKPSELTSDIPPGMDEIITRAMSQQSEERYESAAEMHQALRMVQRELSQQS